MKYTISAVLFFWTTASISQVTHFVSLGPDLGIPSQSIRNSKSGFGGSFEYQVKFAGPIGAQLHLGYSNFGNKTFSQYNVSFLPVRAGLVGFIYQDLIFVAVDAGISHYYVETYKIKQNGLSLGAGAGYRLFVGGKQFVQLSAYYNSHKYRNSMTAQNFNYNWFNIRAAFGLKFGKAKTLEQGTR